MMKNPADKELDPTEQQEKTIRDLVKKLTDDPVISKTIIDLDNEIMARQSKEQCETNPKLN